MKFTQGIILVFFKLNIKHSTGETRRKTQLWLDKRALNIHTRASRYCVGGVRWGSELMFCIWLITGICKLVNKCSSNLGESPKLQGTWEQNVRRPEKNRGDCDSRRQCHWELKTYNFLSSSMTELTIWCYVAPQTPHLMWRYDYFDATVSRPESVNTPRFDQKSCYMAAKQHRARSNTRRLI